MRLQTTISVVFLAGLASVWTRPTATACGSSGAHETRGWRQSYDAGCTGDSGAYAGGSEIMHLAAHQGKLYAANGYWMDSRWTDPPYCEKQSAQVLRLDEAGGRWQVDLDLGKSSDSDSDGACLRYMKGNVLKSVTFTRDGSGEPLPRPQNLLVIAAGAHPGGEGVVSVWVRDDNSGRWNHQVVLRRSRNRGVRYIPRDMEVYRDKVTGAERLFLLCGNPGIISGTYDGTRPTRIRWDRQVEFPRERPFATRPLGIAQANGALFFSVGGALYQRNDGARPSYRKVLDLGDGVNTDMGGIRGLTAIANPGGPGQSLLLVWAPRGRSAGRIKRLDPDGNGGYTVHEEASLRDLMREKLGVDVLGVLGGYNDFFAVTNPATGRTVRLVGFQGTLRNNKELTWKPGRYYAGALYAVRAADRTYTVHEVNGPYRPGERVLVAPRTFAFSPFGGDRLFVGGHDANFARSDEMAWVFQIPLHMALGH